MSARPVSTCVGCGQGFYRRKRPHDARKYCSRACAFAHWSEIRQQDARSVRARARALEPRRCSSCSQPVAVPRKRFCETCERVRAAEQAESHRLQVLEYIRKKRGTRAGVLHTCPSCGETFTGMLQRVFCSRTCARQGNFRGLRFSKHPVDERELLASMAALARAGYQQLDRLQNPNNPCRANRRQLA